VTGEPEGLGNILQPELFQTAPYQDRKGHQETAPSILVRLATARRCPRAALGQSGWSRSGCAAALQPPSHCRVRRHCGCRGWRAAGDRWRGAGIQANLQHLPMSLRKTGAGCRVAAGRPSSLSLSPGAASEARTPPSPPCARLNGDGAGGGALGGGIGRTPRGDADTTGEELRWRPRRVL